MTEYQVGRIIDPSQRMHSGNVEYVGGLFDNKADAQALAEKLNGKAMVEKLADKYYYKELSHD